VRVAGLIIVAATGPQDQTRASIPFHIAANGASPIGVEAGIVLAGDAADLIKPHVIAEVKGVGLPPLKDLVEKCLSQNVRFYV
jgi:predicted peroxiredoxin